MIEPKSIAAHAFARASDEWYVEPPAATAFLLQREQPTGLVLDPCCGGGNIVNELLLHGYRAVGSDIHDRRNSPFWFRGKRDFLSGPIDRDVRNIWFNPPYGGQHGAAAFIKHALAQPLVETVAAFVEAKFLFSESRAGGFYRKHAPTVTYPVFPRLSCPPGDYIDAGGKPEEGRQDHVWMFWRRHGGTGPWLHSSKLAWW